MADDKGEKNLSDYFTSLLIKLLKENIRVVHSPYMQKKKKNLLAKKKIDPSDILAFFSLSHTHTHKRERNGSKVHHEEAVHWH